MGQGGTEPADDYTLLYRYGNAEHLLLSDICYIRGSYHTTVSQQKDISSLI